MKEIKSILQLYDSYGQGTEKCAIAQVVRVEESSYRREGARMIVFENGTFEGGISGGCLEGDALQRSQIAILKKEPSIVTYDTSKDDENQIGVGLGCNGVIDVLITPITQEGNTLNLLQRCVASRKAHILVTVTATNTPDVIALGQNWYYDTATQTLENFEHQALKASLEKDIQTVLDSKRSKIYHYNLNALSVSAFIELIPPQFHLAIYGDNYDVYPMINLAEVMDWEVSLVGKLQKLRKDKLGAVKDLYQKDDTEQPLIDDRTAVVLMAHDYKTDLRNLINLVNSPTPYIASLGPKKRFKKMVNELEDRGTPLTPEQLERIYAPCGLEIGANTPEEIAASIFAEILSVFSGKKGGMLREKQEPIHERY
ncbi:XdhC family protein [Robertkochia marina]|uniref:XdhC family protein n=1 Tax=Robertkochia marina TaxID=1227945 RepID=A0A4S3M1A6_9FLAO|nr:XdhC family protein [Robertkochia marina]THD68864.1 XdhC family protein [Robertkochia marina]TRZ41110.1 XdhC family protein [Robertkochia marina]